MRLRRVLTGQTYLQDLLGDSERMMDNNYCALFALLRVAVNGKCNSLPQSVDWGAVVSLVAKQGVGALAWDGLMSLYEEGHVSAEQLPPSPIKLRWIGVVQRAERNYAQQLQAMTSLDNQLQQGGLRMLAFKGISLSLYYPTPNHRECCDVDAYELNGKQEELQRCLEQGGAEIDHSNPKHVSVVYQGTCFELHQAFLWSFASRKVKRMNEELVALLAGAERLLDFKCIYKPSLEFDSRFVLIHAANHYKTEGLAIRHVIDWALVMQACGYTWNEEWLKRYGLLLFASILNRIAREHLGFDIPETLCQCDDSIYERVLNDILYPQYEAERGTSKGNLIVRKYKRFTSRKWIYPLVGDNFWQATLSSAVAHILDPISIFRGNK